LISRADGQSARVKKSNTDADSYKSGQYGEMSWRSDDEQIKQYSMTNAGGSKWAWLLAALLGCVAAFVIAVQIPEPPTKPVGDIYQKGSGAHRSVVVQIDPAHRLENGSVTEGWLLRDRWGTEVWFPATNLPKAELVLRR